MPNNKISTDSNADRLGPVREIARVLHVREKDKRRDVKLTCGHERSVDMTMKQARCRSCRTAVVKKAAVVKREPVTSIETTATAEA